MSGRRRLASAQRHSGAGAANADLFDGTPWKPLSAQQVRPVLRVVHSVDFAEMLSVTEDLWMRIARCPGLCMQVANSDAHSPAGQNVRLLIREIPGATCSEAKELLVAVQNQNRYRWRAQDGHGQKCHQLLSLVQCISWRSNTLVIELAAKSYLARHMGNSGTWQIQALIDRVKAADKAVSQWSVAATAVSTDPQRVGDETVQERGAGQIDSAWGSEYWQQQMRAIKRSMDAGGV